MKETIEFKNHLQTIPRIIVFLFGLVPLIAPYEILIQTDWQSYFNLYFAFALLICLGAITVSFFFFMFALLGLDELVVIDPITSSIRHEWSSPVLKSQFKTWSFSEISELNVLLESWSDGADYYQLEFVNKNGEKLKFAKFSTEEQANQKRNEIVSLIGLTK